MQKVSFLLRVLALLFVLAVAAWPAAAFDGCRAADVDGNGFINIADVSDIIAAIGSLDPRLDLDGSDDLVDLPDALMAIGHVFRTCTDCTADLDGDLDVDGDDRDLLEAAFGTECRADLDRNGIIEENDADLAVEYFKNPGIPLRPPAARADFDGNGVVNLNDVLFVISNFGNDCRADLNADGAVDTNDLWVLLASWGVCP